MESLYVCLFSNGHIKVGRSSNPETRIQQHAERVACVGVSLVMSESVECDGAVDVRESRLILRCAEMAKARFQNEWFSGLVYGNVCCWAHEAARMELDESVRDSFGWRLRQARTNARMTQADLARGMAVGGGDLLKASVSTWELDQCSPNVNQLRLLCERLGVSADHLLGIKQPVLPPSP